MEKREGAEVLDWVVGAEISKLLRYRYGPSAVSGMEVSDHDFYFRQMPPDGGLQVAESDRLEPQLGIVIILNRGLEEQEFHARADS